MTELPLSIYQAVTRATSFLATCETPMAVGRARANPIAKARSQAAGKLGPAPTLMSVMTNDIAKPVIADTITPKRRGEYFLSTFTLLLAGGLYKSAARMGQDQNTSLPYDDAGLALRLALACRRFSQAFRYD